MGEILSVHMIMTGLDVKNVEKCMGDPNADSENLVLKEEQDAQVFVYHYYSSYNLFYVFIFNSSFTLFIYLSIFW